MFRVKKFAKNFLKEYEIPVVLAYFHSAIFSQILSRPLHWLSDQFQSWKVLFRSRWQRGRILEFPIHWIRRRLRHQVFLS